MFEEITRLTGKERGSTSIIIAGIHGDERCGVEVLKEIVSTLEIKKGEVLFVYGNPRAIELNKRYDEADLNRMFKDKESLSDAEKSSYEYNRAQVLKKYLNEADALLDIHASFTLESTPFVICEANAKGIVEHLPVGLVVSGFDRIEPGGTDYYMNSVGKIGICVECGYLNDPKSVKIAKKSIFAFLTARGHLLGDLEIAAQSYIQMHDLYVNKSDTFVLAKPFADFEEISKEQIIGMDGETEIRAKEDSIILFARNIKRAGDEAFLLGKKKSSLT